MLLSPDLLTHSRGFLTPLTPIEYGDLAELGLAVCPPTGLFSWILELIDPLMGLPWFRASIAGAFFIEHSSATLPRSHSGDHTNRA
jgi:hypothetical protein